MDVAGTSGQNRMRQFGRVMRTELSEETHRLSYAVDSSCAARRGRLFL